MGNNGNIKNILIVCPSLGIGGRERIAVNTFNVLKEKYNVLFAVFQRKDVEYLFDGKIINLNAFSKDSVVKKFFVQIKRAFFIAKISHENNIDIVFAFGEAAYSAACLAKFFGIKKVISAVHGFAEVNNSKRMKFILERSDIVICISQEMKAEIESRYKYRCRVVTIENGYDIEAIRKSSISENVTVLGQPSLIAMGRLESEKGYGRMIKAFCKIHKVFPNSELTLLGDGSEKDNLNKLIKSLCLEDSVHLLGIRKNPYCYLKNADILLLTSYSEGFPNVLIESMVCQLPIVSADCRSGPREILSDGFSNRRICGIVYEKYGVLVEDSDNENDFSNKFASAVVNLFNDKEVLKKYRENSVERANTFSTEAYKLKLFRLLDEQF